MSDPQPTDGTPSPAANTTRAPRGRARRIIAGLTVGSLVTASMVWGGVVANAAVVAERQAEQQRVLALGDLLDDRSAAAELLASTGGVLSALDAAELAADSPAHAAASVLAAEHARLERELARPLDRETAMPLIHSQHRLLESGIGRVVGALDDSTRTVFASARTALEESPLATESTKQALAGALGRLEALRQGLPSSYAGRGALLGDALVAASTVRTSDAEEKAERERREAARRAAEEARQQSASRRPPKKAYVTVLVWCGVDEFDQIIWCEERVEVFN